MIPGVEGFSPGLRLCLLIAAPCKKMKRDTLKSGLPKKEEDTGDEFRKYSIAGRAIPATNSYTDGASSI